MRNPPRPEESSTPYTTPEATAAYRKRLADATSIKPNVIQQREWEKRPDAGEPATPSDCPVCRDTLEGTIDPTGLCTGCGHRAYDPADFQEHGEVLQALQSRGASEDSEDYPGGVLRWSKCSHMRAGVASIDAAALRHGTGAALAVLLGRGRTQSPPELAAAAEAYDRADGRRYTATREAAALWTGSHPRCLRVPGGCRPGHKLPGLLGRLQWPAENRDHDTAADRHPAGLLLLALDHENLDRHPLCRVDNWADDGRSLSAPDNARHHFPTCAPGCTCHGSPPLGGPDPALEPTGLHGLADSAQETEEGPRGSRDW